MNATLNAPGAASTLIEMMSSSWMSQAICAAAELGIADRLNQGAKDIDDLAQSTQTHPGSLRRLMKALASLGLCTERDGGSFELTTTGALLRTDVSDSLHASAIWWGRYRWPLPGELREYIKTGARHCSEHSGRAYRDGDTTAEAVFNRSMVELTRLAAAEVMRVRDFSKAHRVADIGGGFGEMLAALLTAHPRMQGTLLDLPPAIAGAAEHLARAGVSERCELVAGSFFDSVPHGADVYLLKSVLHSWDDAHCRLILRNCRAAMSKDARLMLVERIMSKRMVGDARERSAARSDLQMLLGSGGLERTQAEFVALLDDTGFEAIGFTPAGRDHWLIEAGQASRDPV